MGEFLGKTVIVTGGANGIGRAIVQAYAGEGANIIIADMDEENSLSLENSIGKQSLFVRTDVTKETDISKMVEKTIQAFGKIDILINNVGISKFVPFFEMTLEQWDKILNTNLRSVFLCTRESVKYMKSSGGSIINIASTRATMSEANTEAYSASKGGIVSLTHSMAITLSEFNIHVNSISPGWIQTEDYEKLRGIDHEQHPSRRVGRPEDIARCCLFLTNPKNDFITGENIVIDGGMTKKMIYEE